MVERTLVALGGHVLGGIDPPSTQQEILEKAGAVARALSPLLASRAGLLVVHGNGPQVGIEILRGEMARPRLPPFRLDVSVAQTQGATGYVLAWAFREEIRRRGLDLPVAAVVTSVVVREDEAILKPVGPILTRDEARAFEKDRGWRVAGTEHGLRRVVPSPRPVGVLELDSIRLLHSAGHLVIAGGGGGVPLAADERSSLRGVEAVVDKDRTATLLAVELGLSRIVHLTSVDAVYRDYGTPLAAPIAGMTVEEARHLWQADHFPDGSMGPKIEASLDFLQAGGESVVITTPERLTDALAKRAGTWIVHTLSV
jgi:carbamate kinase